MTHKYRKGDKVAVFVDFFNGYIPAEVSSVDRNLLNVKTPKGQTFSVSETDVEPIMLKPRPRREVVRLFGFPAKEEPSSWRGYKKGK